MDGTTITGLIVMGGFPWLNQLSNIKINFISDHIADLTKIYSFLASFSAIGTILICTNLAPTKAYFLTQPLLPLAIGFVIFLIHFWIFVIFKDYISQNAKTFQGGLLLTFHFITYVSVFCFFSLGVSAVKHGTTFEIIEGKIVEEKTELELYNVEITLLSESGGDIASAKTNDDGSFVIIVRKEELSNIKKGSASDNIHPDCDIVFNNQSEILWKLEHIVMADKAD